MKIYFTQPPQHNLNASVARGIAVLCVNTFLYPRQQTRVTNNIPPLDMQRYIITSIATLKNMRK